MLHQGGKERNPEGIENYVAWVSEHSQCWGSVKDEAYIFI